MSIIFDKKKIMKGEYTILAVNYHYLNKKINGSNIANKVKQFYENNSRHMLRFTIKFMDVNIPYNLGRFGGDQVIEMARKQINARFPQKFDYYIHFCNPKISHAGRGNASTYASYTNAVHEFGHLLGFGHSNTWKYEGNKVSALRSRDPFDVMTMFSPYQSLNPVNRFKKGWFLDGEIATAISGTKYKMAMLKDVRNTTDLKTLVIDANETSQGRKFWLSFGTWHGKTKLVFHTSNPAVEYTYLDGFFEANVGQVISHPRACVSLSVSKVTSSIVEFTLTKFSVKNKLSMPEEMTKNEVDEMDFEGMDHDHDHICDSDDEDDDGHCQCGFDSTEEIKSEIIDSLKQKIKTEILEELKNA